MYTFNMYYEIKIVPMVKQKNIKLVSQVQSFYPHLQLLQLSYLPLYKYMKYYTTAFNAISGCSLFNVYIV